MTYILIGLGNPNKEYAGTRHNVGKFTAEYLAGVFKTKAFEQNSKVKALEGLGKIGKEEIMIVLPEVYMNTVGKIIPRYIRSKKDLEKLIIIYDDLDLPLGKFKISFGRSSGGHRGLESVIKNLKSKDFTRVRIGISPSTPTGKLKKPSGEKAVISFILGKFKPTELTTLKKIQKKITEAVEAIVTEGKEFAMSRFN